MTEPIYTERGATFDTTETYRYRLWRSWNSAQWYDKKILFIMLNPSTADAEVLDPTVRRCVGYSQDLSFERMEVVNLFALRSTDPKVLKEAGDPVGADNDNIIKKSAASSDLVIAAWGVHGNLKNRAKEVLKLLDWKDIHCLSITNSGDPGHPLYLKKKLVPVMYQKGKTLEELMGEEN